MNAAAKTSCQIIEKTLGKSPAFKKIDEGLFEAARSEEHTSELHSHLNLVCRLLLEKKKKMVAAALACSAPAAPQDQDRHHAASQSYPAPRRRAPPNRRPRRPTRGTHCHPHHRSPR